MSVPRRPVGRRLDRRALPVLPLVLAASLLAACGGNATEPSSSGTPSTSASAGASPSAAPTVPAATGPVKTTKLGVSVTGNVGDKPAVTVPSGAAPTTLQTEVLVEGTGKTVAKGEALVANYLGQTWALKDGKADVFDNSWDRSAPAKFLIGTGQVIPGWDQGLVGQKVGSRVLLVIPPALAYGATPSSDNALAGKALVFVVDILDSLSVNASATGTAAGALPAGFPTVTSVSGKQPAITSVAGVTVPAQPASALLLKGTGATIDKTKQLALQLVQTDTATGKNTQVTWGKDLSFVPAVDVLSLASALEGQKVGSRVLIITPKSANQDSLVVVVDVIGQY